MTFSKFIGILINFFSDRFRRKPKKKQLIRFYVLMRYMDNSHYIFLEKNQMKRLSTAVKDFLITAIALTVAGVHAAVDGAIALISSDPNVLLVSPLGDGKFRVTVVGKGKATLTVSADADLGDGVRTISQNFEFEIYDVADEADHFDLSISDLTLVEPVAETPQDQAA